MAQGGQHKNRRRHRSRQACQIHSAEKGPETERKEEALKKGNGGPPNQELQLTPSSNNLPLSRATPLHSVALRAASRY